MPQKSLLKRIIPKGVRKTFKKLTNKNYRNATRNAKHNVDNDFPPRTNISNSKFKERTNIYKKIYDKKYKTYKKNKNYKNAVDNVYTDLNNNRINKRIRTFTNNNSEKYRNIYTKLHGIYKNHPAFHIGRYSSQQARKKKGWNKHFTYKSYKEYKNHILSEPEKFPEMIFQINSKLPKTPNPKNFVPKTERPLSATEASENR